MNIDYQKMTEAAATRVAALKDIERLVSEAGANIDPLNQLIAYVKDIGDTLKRLDAEGRDMIDPALLRSLNRVAESYSSLKGLQCHTYNGGGPIHYTGISVIAEHAK